MWEGPTAKDSGSRKWQSCRAKESVAQPRLWPQISPGCCKYKQPPHPGTSHILATLTTMSKRTVGTPMAAMLSFDFSSQPGGEGKQNLIKGFAFLSQKISKHRRRQTVDCRESLDESRVMPAPCSNRDPGKEHGGKRKEHCMNMWGGSSHRRSQTAGRADSSPAAPWRNC